MLNRWINFNNNFIALKNVNLPYILVVRSSSFMTKKPKKNEKKNRKLDSLMKSGLLVKGNSNIKTKKKERIIDNPIIKNVKTEKIESNNGYSKWVENNYDYNSIIRSSRINNFKNNNIKSPQFIKAKTSNWNKTYSWDDLVNSVANDVFNIKEFRSNQREIINASLSNEDLFLLLPTGSGKSLTYQLPAICTKGLTVVISPLLALISDQIQKMTALGIPVDSLSSSDGIKKQKMTMAKLRQGNINFSSIVTEDDEQPNDVQFTKDHPLKLLYLTPERLVQPDFISTLQNYIEPDTQSIDENSASISRFIIDEVHTVEEWSGFRPDYGVVGKILKNYFPDVPITAVTATATKSTREYILKSLQLQSMLLFQASFHRSNLLLNVERKNEKSIIPEILNILQTSHINESGIIYCMTIADCKKVYEYLMAAGVDCAIYNGKMSTKARNYMQNLWMKDEAKVMCTTIAFGMGIDKPDIRFVIHHSLPSSIESYYQQIGRAGRDSKPASCTLFYSYKDKKRLEELIVGYSKPKYWKQRKYSTSDETSIVINNPDDKLALLDEMYKYCVEKNKCRNQWILEYFDENTSNSCGNCDYCLSMK